MNPIPGFVAYVRARSGVDIALITVATSVGLWLSSRVVLVAGDHNSLFGVVVGTAAGLLVMACWAVVVWIWFTRGRNG